MEKITVGNSNVVTIAVQAANIAALANVLSGMLIYSTSLDNDLSIEFDVTRLKEALAQFPREVMVISKTAEHHSV